MLWVLSVALEAIALLAYQWRGGFPAFRAMLFIDVLGQTLCIMLAGTDQAYRYAHRGTELACTIATAFAVMEAAPRTRHPKLVAGTIAACCAPVHMALWEPLWWSHTAGLVWSFTGVSHLIMAIYLVMAMIEARKATAHRCLLLAYLSMVTVSFYLAPQYEMAHWVEGMQAALWVGFALAALICPEGARF